MNLPTQTPESDARRKAKAAACEKYLVRATKDGRMIPEPNRNVIGIGIGPKLKDQKEVAPHAVRFYVEKKTRKHSDIPPHFFLPPTIEGLPTDVIEVGRFRCSSSEGVVKGKDHVIQPGTSCGVKFGRCGDGSTGTIGAIVSRGKKRYILSSAHVLARAQGFLLGSPILCPGPTQLPMLANEGPHHVTPMGHNHGRDVPVDPPLPGAELFHRARLADFKALSLDEPNEMDAALAEITKPPFNPEIAGIGALTSSSPLRALKGMRVMKNGLGTGLSRGRVVDTDFDGHVDFSSGPLKFDNQILIEGDDASSFAWEGDSGALVVTRFVWNLNDKAPEEPQLVAVAMVVGFSMPESTSSAAKSYCVATDLSLILDRFGAELVVS